MVFIISPARIHVLTRSLEWTILRQPDKQGRGVGAISDVRRRSRPWTTLVADSGKPGPTINDPLSGGLAHVGLIACLPANGTAPNPGNFWNEAWELTSRGPAGAGGYGCGNIHVDANPATGTVDADADLLVNGHVCMHIAWRYTFHPDDHVDLVLTLRPLPVPGLYVKEPKVVFNGLHGYQQIQVYNIDGELIREEDMRHVVNPVAHTIHFTDPQRRHFHLTAPDRPTLALEVDNVLNSWATEANTVAAMSPDAIRVDGSFGPAAAYCTTANGAVMNRTEMPRWQKTDVAGLAVHGWVGGYGAPDCWNCFRRLTLSRQTLRARIAFS